MAEYVIKAGSIHEQFMNSRAKIQIAGGGFANGKTATSCVKALRLAQDYPGSNGLIGRATYPKLNDTVRREFFKWCPRQWIKSFSKSDNTLELINGSTVNFRYVQQKNSEGSASSTSNLLSATYDWIVIDQMDDPEFEYKDFTDLLGRLRGSAAYTGNDSTMPRTGPRWLVITLNPTRNWIYKRLVRHVLDFQEKGVMSKELAGMLERYEATNAAELIEVITGSTYENIHNLESDYVRTLEATYQGAMRDRFLMGGWQAYKGLVYPMYHDMTHMVDEDTIREWIDYYSPNKIIESFDWGMSKPSCYLLFACDGDHNVVALTGFHEKELSPEEITNRIKKCRADWGIDPNISNPIFADPAIFRRSGGEFRTVGKSLADVFNQSGAGVVMVRGNNDITSGLVKVGAYLTVSPLHRNPFTRQMNAPFLYFNRDTLEFVDDEITDYYFKQADNEDDIEDKPQDKNDHAMDALKYGLTGTPDIAALLPKKPVDRTWMRQWHERQDDQGDDWRRSGRYG